MNDTARELLVQAALNGHKQIKGQMHDYGFNEGECALGILHLALHHTRKAAIACNSSSQATLSMKANSYMEVQKAFDISREDANTIINKNDEAGWDFLTISRKC